MTTPFVLPTLQELFNIGWQHFVVNNAPLSYFEDTGRCSYRGPNGAKCIIGLVIPDEVYDKAFDVLNAHIMRLIDDGILAPAPGYSKADYHCAQSQLHDSLKWSDTPEKREWHYRRFAAQHNLTVPGE